MRLCFFFFKQKTADEMRISDWSSDVCSSDLSHIVFDRMASVPASAPAAIGAEAPEKLSNIVQMSEFAHIRETLKACGGSRIETARKLGISERTLRYRLAKAREQGDDIARVASA